MTTTSWTTRARARAMTTGPRDDETTPRARASRARRVVVVVVPPRSRPNLGRRGRVSRATDDSSDDYTYARGDAGPCSMMTLNRGAVDYS